MICEELTMDYAYRVRSGARLRNSDAQVVGDAVVALQKRLKRDVTPADVLAAARKRGNPLHALYERLKLWDDRVAAERARLDYAGYLLRSIEIVRLDEHAEPVNFAAFDGERAQQVLAAHNARKKCGA